ncbi:MAG TPA: hypothetical protein VIY09_05185 [Rhizomicrobium sp.]
MAIARRECLHHYFLAECSRCGFAVEGEIRNGYGGWKEYDWNGFGRSCTHRTSAGKPTMVCPHLRAAKLAAQPLSAEDFRCRVQSGCDRNAEAVEGAIVAVAPVS